MTSNNPCTELFTRKSIDKKAEIIKALTKTDLLGMTKDMVKRMVKETGIKQTGSRCKCLRIDDDRRKGNNWNSVVEAITMDKGKLYVYTYVQYSNTDRTMVVPYEDFFKRGEYMGTVKTTDCYGNPQTYYYRYDEGDKAEVLRSVCLEYLYRKGRK